MEEYRETDRETDTQTNNHSQDLLEWKQRCRKRRKKVVLVETSICRWKGRVGLEEHGQRNRRTDRPTT